MCRDAGSRGKVTQPPALSLAGKETGQFQLENDSYIDRMASRQFLLEYNINIDRMV